MPTTSGTAPPVVATSGTPHAIASTAGSENPSYSDGTTATSASAYSSTMRSVVTPCTNRTAPCNPSRSMIGGIRLFFFGLPMITSSASLRSVRTLASASSSTDRPFMGMSELVVVISRPGTRAMSGIGRNSRGIDADRHDVQALGIDTHLRDDVALAVLGHGDDARHRARDAASACRGSRTNA